jgi:hypothetical protein
MADEVMAGEGTPQTGAGQDSPADAVETTQSGTENEDTADATTDGNTESPDGAEASQEGNSEDAEESEEPEGAPESYEDFTLPEGVTAKEEDLAAFKDLAKDLNLSQSQAQKLIDLEAKRVSEMQKAQRESIAKHLADVKEEWVSDVKKAWGDEFDTKAADAVRAAEIGSDEFRALMNGKDPKLPGIVLADHPAVAEFLATVGAKMSEAEFVKGGAGARRNKSTADALYGTVDVQKPD